MMWVVMVGGIVLLVVVVVGVIRRGAMMMVPTTVINIMGDSPTDGRIIPCYGREGVRRGSILLLLS